MGRGPLSYLELLENQDCAAIAQAVSCNLPDVFSFVVHDSDKGVGEAAYRAGWLAACAEIEKRIHVRAERTARERQDA